MYAVFSTGGKQYRASAGDVIKVEKLEAEKGATVELDQVLMIGEGADVNVGTPYVEGGKVVAKVVDHGRGEKIKIIKFKRRKNHMKHQGHRQYFTALEITDIVTVGKPEAKSEPKAAKAEDDKPAKKKAAAKKTASKKKVAKKTAVKKAEAPESKGEE